MDDNGEVIESTNHAILEKGLRLSSSMLWRYERQFFQRMGIHSWSQGHVPHYITTNSFIGRSYANVLLGWARDHRAALKLEEPLHVIELGAGTGCFAFHVLGNLQHAFQAPALRAIRLRYVMTDFSERNLGFWLEHPRLAPFIKSGLLDFALFDPTQDDSLTLHRARETLGPGQVANPVAVLANYFFDSTPHDCFAVDGGTLDECFPTVSCEGPAPEEGDPELLSRLKIEFDRRPVEGEPYDDPVWNAVLQAYAGRLDDTVFTFPVAALRCLENLSRLAGGRLLLLSGDKGRVREEELLGRPEPRFTPHGGCFSLPVNYHALAEVVRRRGARVLLPPRHFHLAVVAFLLGANDQDWGETRLAFDESIVQGGPDHFYSLKKGIESAYGSLNPEQLLAWLRFSGWDARILGGSARVVIEAASSLEEPLRNEWIRAVGRVWDNYYSIGEKDDVPYILGRVLNALGQPSEALGHFHRSIELHGPAAVTLYYMAECHQRLGQVPEALGYLDTALKLEPNDGLVRALRIKLLSESITESSCGDLGCK